MPDYFQRQGDGALDGPHDLLAVTRRIKQGKITPSSLLQRERGGQGAQAGQFPELMPIFREITHHSPEPNAPNPRRFTWFGWWTDFKYNRKLAFRLGIGATLLLALFAVLAPHS